MLNSYKHEIGNLHIKIASPIAYLGFVSLILARPHTFTEIYHEIFSMVILLALIQEGLLSLTSESMCTVNWLIAYSKLSQEK